MNAEQDKRLKDVDWMRQTFLLSADDITTRDMVNRVMSTADVRFADTTIGGSAAINMPYQFTRYADLKAGLSYKGYRKVDADVSLGRYIQAARNTAAGALHGDVNWQDIVSGRAPAREGDTIGSISDDYPRPDDNIGDVEAIKGKAAGSYGMGRYYQESIEQHSILVHMRFGVPEYNTLTRFLGNFYSHEAGMVANRGVGAAIRPTNVGGAVDNVIQSGASSAGKLVGGILALPFYPFMLASKFIRVLADIPATKFYYLKPTMANYRAAVSNILNSIAVNMGISPYAPDRNSSNIFEGTGGSPLKSNEYRKAMHEMLPDIIGPDGYVDIMAISTRYQRKANRLNDALREELKDDLYVPWSRLRDNLNRFIDNIEDNDLKPEFTSESDYISRYYEVESNKSDTASGGSINIMGGGSLGTPTDPNSVEGGRDMYAFGGGNRENANTIYDYLEGEWRDGAQFVTFRVDNPGSMSESFSNQTRESDIQQKINSAAASARSARFDFAGGNLAGGIGTVVNSIENFIGGITDSLGFSGLLAAAGNAFVDIPKTWDSSNAQLPRAEYTVKLRAAYGNPISRYFDLYIPLAHLLAGALPLATGPQSHTSPFICECYSTHRVAIRLGMIESMTVTRATGNLPYADDGGVMGIDVSFSVVDLSSVMAMPIVTASLGRQVATGTAVNIIEGLTNQAVGESASKLAVALSTSTWSEDNVFTDYMAVLGGLSLNEMVYGTRKVQLRMAQGRQNLRQWRSPANMAAAASDTLVGRIFRAAAMPGEQDFRVRR